MIKKIFKKYNFYDVLRLIVGSVLIFAAIPKIIDPLDFAFSLSSYTLFPSQIIPYLAVFVPFLELVTGILILTGLKYEGATIIAMGMFIVFIFSLAYAIILGLDINCGCYGQDLSEKSNLWVRILEDLWYLVACIFILMKSEYFSHKIKK